MWFIILFVVLFLIYYFGQKNFGYWNKRNVPGPKPAWFFGNIGESLIGKKSVVETYSDIYREFKGHALVGIYKVGQPSILVRDLDFIKAMMIKDFEYFHDNDISMDKKTDRLLARNPFFQKGDEWKRTRHALTPCFTAGKIKGMFPLLEDISKKLISYIENHPSPLEVGEVSIRFTVNNVAACAFGLEGRCFEEDDPEFRKISRRFFAPNPWIAFAFLLFSMFPSLASIFKVPFIPKSIEDKLIDIVETTLKHRLKNNSKRNDFLEYVTEIHQQSNLFKEDVLVNITAQAATFFGDGTETTSRVMRFTLFEIAYNLEIQEKLRNEINITCKKYGDKLTYDGIQEMIYLDAVLNEGMRKHPAFGHLFKMCTETYTYTPSDPEYKKNTVRIEAGTPIILPVSAIQKDEKYFENPEDFIPERFLDKDKINKYAFMPFGDGPRSCLGMRFGLAQIKLGIAQIVKNFEMTVNSKTQLPIKYDKMYVLLDAVGGLWVDFKKI